MHNEELNKVVTRSKVLLFFGAVALISLGLGGCGGSKLARSVPSTSKSGDATATIQGKLSAGYLKQDGDDDHDDRGGVAQVENDDQGIIAIYSGAASTSDIQEIKNLIKRYYMAAAMNHATVVCSMLHSSFIAGLIGERSASRPEALAACAATISPQLRYEHRRLVAGATVVVTGVHLKGGLGMVTLGFKRSPEAELTVEREGGTWKLDSLFATDLT